MQNIKYSYRKTAIHSLTVTNKFLSFYIAAYPYTNLF